MANNEVLTILKIGGDIIDNAALLEDFFTHFKTVTGPAILVHGGGNRASLLQKQLGIEPQKIAGRRITDEATLEVVTMVYAGLLNKKLVAGLQALHIPAVGLSGADGDVVRAHKREVQTIDYGFAGDIDRVNGPFITSLLTSGQLPVFCPITHNGFGQLLNTNADTLAAQIAMEMSATYEVELYYCFTKPGVLEDVGDPTSIVTRMDPSRYALMKEEGKIVDGMIPKLDTAFDALRSGVTSVHLGTTAILSDQELKHTVLCL